MKVKSREKRDSDKCICPPGKFYSLCKIVNYIRLISSGDPYNVALCYQDLQQPIGKVINVSNGSVFHNSKHECRKGHQIYQYFTNNVGQAVQSPGRENTKRISPTLHNFFTSISLSYSTANRKILYL